MRFLSRTLAASLLATVLALPTLAYASPSATHAYHVEPAGKGYVAVDSATINALESQDHGNLKAEWNVTKAVSYANRYWNCADPSCSSRVNAGDGQPNFQCAEFVARSLAAGGMVPGLNINSPQSAYEYYKVQGKTYDLLWVSSKQGGPLGLEDWMKLKGWSDRGTSGSYIKAGAVVFTVGSDGAWSHVVFGVGANMIDAHNYAHYHLTDASGYYQVVGVYTHN